MPETIVYAEAGEHVMKKFITVADGQQLVGDALAQVYDAGREATS